MSPALIQMFIGAPRQLSSTRHLPGATKINTIRSRRTFMAVTADLPVASDISTNDIFFRPMKKTVSAVRKYLLKTGMKEAWVDGVAAEITKKSLKTSVEQCEAVINYLTSLGLSIPEIENMVSLNKQILGSTVDELTAVVSYLEKEGLSNKEILKEFLMANSYILSYKPSSDGTCLEKGRARAALTFGERHGKKVAGIVQWREGASFGVSPVSPELPQKL